MVGSSHVIAWSIYMVGELMVQSRVASALAGAALSVLVLTGCQGGDAGVAQTPSDSPSASASASASESPSATPSPTPSPASAAGPAVNIPVPEKPALADENSVEGLEAFTEWWFELVSYGYIMNDVTPMQDVTDPGCLTCKNIEGSIAEVYADGGWMSGGRLTVDSHHTQFEVNVHGSVDAYVTNTQAPIKVYSASGELINEIDEHVDEKASLFRATFVDGEWLTIDYGSIEISNE